MFFGVYRDIDLNALQILRVIPDLFTGGTNKDSLSPLMGRYNFTCPKSKNKHSKYYCKENGDCSLFLF